MARKKPTFEEALAELESIAEEIEEGKIGLEDSIKKYQQGMKLIGQCRTILDSAEQRIQQLELEEDEAAKRTDFEETGPTGDSGL